MFYLNLLNMRGFTGFFPFAMVNGRVSRQTWKRIVHVARGYLAQQKHEEVVHA